MKTKEFSDMQSWNYNDTWQNENIDIAEHNGVSSLVELEEIYRV